jgi:Tol biopolymer transport system component
VQAGQERLSIVRKTEGGTPETVREGGFNAAVLPDESAVVYVRNTGPAQSLRKKPLGDGGPDCELLPDTVFQAIGLPRVSPDGTRLAFAASGEAAPRAGDCARAAEAPARPQAELPDLLSLADWLGLAPRTAWAHGLPWDVWTMNVDGTGLSKVAILQEDEPNVAWAPDGSQIAVFGTAALYVVDAKGGQPRTIEDGGGYGGLDWTR